MATCNKLNQVKYAKLIKLLTQAPRTAHELAEAVELHVVNTQGLMRTLVEHRVVHISGWVPNSRGVDTTPIYKFGPGRKNAERRKMTPAERTAKYRQNKKQKVTKAVGSWLTLLDAKRGEPSRA
jgi:hypothetical protein